MAAVESALTMAEAVGWRWGGVEVFQGIGDLPGLIRIERGRVGWPEESCSRPLVLISN